MTTVFGNPGSGAGQTSLQRAYDNSTGDNPQILLDAIPTPLSFQAQVAGAVLEIRDVGAANTIFEVDADPDLIVARSGVTIDNAFINGGASTDLTLSATYTQTGAFIGGGILSNGTITTAVSTTWVWALLQESKSYLIGINPAFAAFTLFNALATIGNSGNFNLPQALILNNGVSHRRTTSGTSTTAQNIGLSNSPNTRTLVSGAIMTKTTGDTAVRHAPTFGTVAGSTINFGTQRGLHCINPAAGLFQPGAGAENMTAFIGVEIDAVSFGGNVTKRALRSALTAASNTLMIDNTGGAASDFKNGRIHVNDNTGVNFGNTDAASDVQTYWSSAVSAWRLQFASTGDSMQFSSPAADRFLIDTNGGNSVGEFNFNCARFSMGAQTGAVGNQVGNFVAGARTVSVGGEWSDFLLTQAANITVDAAMGLVAGWTINAPSITLGTGSVTSAGALNVGGNVNQGSVNRFGVRILSNPSGGSGVNAALWVTAGLSRFDGRVDINNGIALGGGAAATLGTIGGSGPTAAAQAQWVEIDIGGTAHWIPVWT